jgi:predicted ATPase
MKLLAKLATYSFRCASKVLMPLAILKSVQLTFEQGTCEFSPPAFAWLGVMFSGVLGDYQMAFKCGKMVLSLMEHLKCRNTESRTIMLVSGFARAWLEPISNLDALLVQGYKAGLSSGDTENAMLVSCLDVCPRRLL